MLTLFFVQQYLSTNVIHTWRLWSLHIFFSPLFTGIPQYFGPLHVNTDIGILAGHSLLVTEKENVQKKSGHYVLKKANSVGYRTTTSRLFSSVSTEECLETNDTTKVTKQTKQRLWSLQLFGVKVCGNFVLCWLYTFRCPHSDSKLFV